MALQGIERNRTRNSFPITQGKGSSGSTVRDSLNFPRGLISILGGDHLNFSISHNGASDKEPVRDKEIKILSLDKGIYIRLTRTPVREGIQTQSTSVSIRPQPSIESIIKGRAQKKIIARASNQSEGDPIDRLD